MVGLLASQLFLYSDINTGAAVQLKSIQILEKAMLGGFIYPTVFILWNIWFLSEYKNS